MYVLCQTKFRLISMSFSKRTMARSLSLPVANVVATSTFALFLFLQAGRLPHLHLHHYEKVRVNRHKWLIIRTCNRFQNGTPGGNHRYPEEPEVSSKPAWRQIPLCEFLSQLICRLVTELRRERHVVSAVGHFASFCFQLLIFVGLMLSYYSPQASRSIPFGKQRPIAKG